MDIGAITGIIGDKAAPPGTIRVYRMEDDLGYGPVAARTTKASLHSPAIEHLIHDLKIPAWLRAIAGRKSPASGMTRRKDWVFGTIRFRDLQDYTASWRGRGCALSIYDVPSALLVEGDSEVMFWRGDFRGTAATVAGRRHPSGLAAVLLHRIPELSLVEYLQSIAPE